MIFGTALMLAAVLLFCINIYRENRAGQESERIVHMIEQDIHGRAAEDPADTEPQETYKTDETEKEEIVIDGESYAGIIEIPSLGLKLPVMKELDYKKLDTAPCVYSGSVYTGDIIIAAHNFRTHFGRLKELESGEGIRFTDCEGETFDFSVTSSELIDGEAADVMESGDDWDMTLFTCTYSGKARIALRCKRV